MHAKISQIGNSKGLRLPKSVLETCNLSENDQVKIETKGNVIYLTPLKHPREGWNAGFSKSTQIENDPMLADFQASLESASDGEWKW